MKIKNFCDPVYNFKINLIYQCSYKDFVYQVNQYCKYDPQDVNQDIRGEFVADREADYYFLFLRDTNDIICLAHELIHLVHLMLTVKGVPVNEHNTEVQAYHHTWWMENIMKAIK
jgi:hypothetical protein